MNIHVSDMNNIYFLTGYNDRPDMMNAHVFLIHAQISQMPHFLQYERMFAYRGYTFGSMDGCEPDVNPLAPSSLWQMCNSQVKLQVYVFALVPN